MKRGSFIFEGVTSESVKTIIQTRPMIDAPARKVESREVYGVDGDVPFDEGAYSNTALELVMLTDGNDLIGDRQKLYSLIDTRGGYKNLIPYFDPAKIYRVRTESIQFENQHFFGEKQAVSAKFTVKPYKYLVNSPTVVLTPAGKIVNPTGYISQPLITITGSGPVRIAINGIEFSIKNVINSITLDSERYLAYQKDTTGALINMNHQAVTKEYPILKPGENVISVNSGTVGKITIEPRWRSLV